MSFLGRLGEGFSEPRQALGTPDQIRFDSEKVVLVRVPPFDCALACQKPTSVQLEPSRYCGKHRCRWGCDSLFDGADLMNLEAYGLGQLDLGMAVVPPQRLEPAAELPFQS